jgi:predicted transcriptional regulator
MGIEDAGLSASLIRNIEHARREKNLSKNELAIRAGIPKSTFYRNLPRPEDFSVKETGRIAEALEVSIIDLIKDPS